MQSSSPWPTVGISHFSIARAAKNSEKCCSRRCYFARWNRSKFENSLFESDQQFVFNFSFRLRGTIEACYRIQRIFVVFILRNIWCICASWYINFTFSFVVSGHFEMHFCIVRGMKRVKRVADGQRVIYARDAPWCINMSASARGTRAVAFRNLFERLKSPRFNEDELPAETADANKGRSAFWI